MIGTFVWYDLMTADTKAAMAFYCQALGYTTHDGGGSGYTGFKHGTETFGGVMALPDEAKAQGAPPHWLGYIAVDDLAATITQATTLGGKVHVPPRDIPTGGSFAILADPHGAAFGVYSHGKPPPSGAPVGTACAWHELMADDVAEAWSFYSALFGWEKDEAMDMGDMGIYQMFKKGGRTIGGLMKRPASMPMAAWGYYLSVDSVERRADAIQSLGGKLISGPMDVPGGDRVATFIDPQGAMFAIHARKA